MPTTATPLLPSTPVWFEIGRPSPGEAQDWATWVSPLDDGGDALYRSLVLAGGAIAVAVELHSRGVSGTRTIHRGRCGLPQDPDHTAERVRLLLGAADRAAARAVEAQRGGGRDDGGMSAPRHGREDRSREHACREAATAA